LRVGSVTLSAPELFEKQAWIAPIWSGVVADAISPAATQIAIAAALVASIVDGLGIADSFQWAGLR
jgi:hypothetical protein